MSRELVDIACLDVGMPHGNGLDVFEMLDRDSALRVLPKIIMTGHSDPRTIRRCPHLCAYYVQKGPDVWSRIEPLLRELLGLSRAASTAGYGAHTWARD